MIRPLEFELCPKCKKNTATSTSNPDGTGRFYCSAKHCGFEVPTQKQDMAKAIDKLAEIKKKMFPS